MTDPRTIAEGLTAARKRIVLGLPTDGRFTDYRVAGIVQRRTRMALTNGGITEPMRSGPITVYSSIRLTPLGIEVRRVLEGG